jgi:hypothetical protein
MSDDAVRVWRNYAAVSVPSTALGTDLLSAAERAALGALARAIVITPTQNIALVDGTATGTYANSGRKIPAGATATVEYFGGPIKAIAESTTATVAVEVGLTQ